MLAACALHGQEDKPYSDSHKGAINIEFAAGLNNTVPLGIDAKVVRTTIRDNEEIHSDYKGGLYPKTAAFGGILLDYGFHQSGAIGFGLLYTPKGYWLFESNIPSATSLPSLIEKRKTFVTVDYFDMPIFFKAYFHGNKFSLRFGPVISMALLSKVRVITEAEGAKTKEKYRLGEGTNNEIFYEGLPNEVPKFIVPGMEAALNYGNASGLQGTLVIGFSGSMFENADVKSFIARIGISYMLSK